jgi:hypothetical protein
LAAAVLDLASIPVLKADIVSKTDHLATVARENVATMRRLGPPKVPGGQAIASAFVKSDVNLETTAAHWAQMARALPTDSIPSFVQQRGALVKAIQVWMSRLDPDWAHAQRLDNDHGHPVYRSFTKTDACQTWLGSGD